MIGDPMACLHAGEHGEGEGFVPGLCCPNCSCGYVEPSDYGNWLRFGDDRGESPIPGDFIHDLDGRVWFVSGGSQCVGCAFCNWHSGMDAVYAVGSSTIANVGIDCETLQTAVELLEAIDPDRLDSPYANEERLWLIELGRAALAATPSDDLQTVYE